jgi:hypothetical protein
MHEVSSETTRLVDLVLDYSRRRMLSSDTPLDKPSTQSELARLAGRTIDERGTHGVAPQHAVLPGGHGHDVNIHDARRGRDRGVRLGAAHDLPAARGIRAGLCQRRPGVVAGRDEC